MKFRNKAKFQYGKPAYTGPFRALIEVNALNLISWHSVSGHTIPPTIFPIYMYAASKHAVTILTEGLRRELVEQNSNIRVTVSMQTLYPVNVTGNLVCENTKDLANKENTEIA
jgi:short-subunit dehydrogenase